MTMTMPDLDLAELDRLHAKATKAEWFYVASMTDEESMRPGGTYADVVIASEDEDSRPVSVLDGPSDSDAELIAALHNAYPSLRARIAELERKARAFDAIELGEIEWEYDPSCKEFAARRNCGKNHWATTLIEAIRCANGGETGAEFQS
jgi:hypothetical protein